MASGFMFQNVDLDLVFAARYSGWPEYGGTTDFEIAGADIKSRYAPLSTGSAAAVSDFIISGIGDLNTIFAGYGTTTVQVGAQPANVSGSSAAGNPSGLVTSGSTACAGLKGSGTYTYLWTMMGSGAYFTNPTSAGTAVAGNVPAGQTISGTMYCTISDGTTSINTATRTWSLTNTTPPITVIPYTVSATAVQPDNAGAAIIFQTNGTEQYQTNLNTPVTIGNWDPSGDGSNYDVMATLVSGTAPNTPGFYNTLNTWVQVTGSLGIGWSITNSVFNNSTMTCVLSISIRLHSTEVVQSTGQITLKAKSIAGGGS
jgi:hypothetical protein